MSAYAGNSRSRFAATSLLSVFFPCIPAGQPVLGSSLGGTLLLITPMRLRCVIVNTVELVDLTGMYKTECFERQDLSRLVHHELKSDLIVVIVSINKSPPFSGPIPNPHFLITHACFNMHIPDQSFNVLQANMVSQFVHATVMDPKRKHMDPE